LSHVESLSLDHEYKVSTMDSRTSLTEHVHVCEKDRNKVTERVA